MFHQLRRRCRECGIILDKDHGKHTTTVHHRVCTTDISKAIMWETLPDQPNIMFLPIEN